MSRLGVWAPYGGDEVVAVSLLRCVDPAGTFGQHTLSRKRLQVDDLRFVFRPCSSNKYPAEEVPGHGG